MYCKHLLKSFYALFVSYCLAVLPVINDNISLIDFDDLDNESFFLFLPRRIESDLDNVLTDIVCRLFDLCVGVELSSFFAISLFGTGSW